MFQEPFYSSTCLCVHRQKGLSSESPTSRNLHPHVNRVDVSADLYPCMNLSGADPGGGGRLRALDGVSRETKTSCNRLFIVILKKGLNYTRIGADWRCPRGVPVPLFPVRRNKTKEERKWHTLR